jgi:hypothetical protein
VDESVKRGARPPRTVTGHVARQVGNLLAEGYPAETIKAALFVLVGRGLNPATLPSVVYEQQVKGGGGPSEERKLSPFARANLFVQQSGWQIDDADLAEMLGRDYGIEGAAKQKLMDLAANLREKAAA